jgi:hypothetical protein
MSFIKEFLKFVIARKKFWLMPIFIALLLLGGLLVLASTNSVLTPFIYTMF